MAKLPQYTTIMQVLLKMRCRTCGGRGAMDSGPDLTMPHRPAHLGNPHPTPLTSWSRPVVVAVVMAYRTAHAEGRSDTQAWQEARVAFIAAGGNPEWAGTDMPLIVSATIRDHCEWFWPPVRARVEREERYWRRRGIWPPPKNRAEWPEIPLDV